MLYHSTRDLRLTAPSTRAVLEGIAPDGGLYICDPAKLDFDWQGALRLDTLSMAAKFSRRCCRTSPTWRTSSAAATTASSPPPT